MSSLDTNGSRGATDFNCGGVWIVGKQPADVLVRLILTDIIIYLTTVDCVLSRIHRREEKWESGCSTNSLFVKFYGI